MSSFNKQRARNLRVGQRFQIPDSDECENFFSGDVFVARSIEVCPDAIEVETGSQDFVFVKSEIILVEVEPQS